MADEQNDTSNVLVIEHYRTQIDNHIAYASEHKSDKNAV